MDSSSFSSLCHYLKRKVGFLTEVSSDRCTPAKRPARTVSLYHTELVASALSGYLKCFKIRPVNGYFPGPTRMLEQNVSECERLVSEELTLHSGIKMWLCLVIEFEKTTDPTNTILAYFGSCQTIVLRGDMFEISACFPAMLRSVENFEQNGSGWRLKQVQQLDIHIANYSPLRAGCFSPLPAYLGKKKAIVNIYSRDNKCFLWCILAALHPRLSHPERMEHYKPYEQELSMNGINFPVELSQISKFEKLNSISVNVYGFERVVYPLRISKLACRRHVNLLLINEHYYLIRSLDRMLGDQNRFRGRKYFCRRCLVPCYSAENLQNHLSNCMQNQPTRILMPKQSKLKFQSISKMLRRPLIVYADFECLTEKISKCEPTSETSYTMPYQLHTPCGVGFIQKFECCRGHFAQLLPPTIYRGKDCVEYFLQCLISIASEYAAMVTNPKPLKLTRAEETTFRDSTICHICQKSLDEDRVRDHCHLCGRYRGASHAVCNQQFHLNSDVIIVFHNLRRYDGHLIMQHLGQICTRYGLSIDCIAKGVEDYVTFSLKKGKQWRLRFIDSCQFLSCSLEKLTNNLSRDKFFVTKKYLADKYPLDLILRKNSYPYDYMDCWERFEEGRLPPQSAFYSELTGENISNTDYAHAREVWKLLEPQTLGQYHDFYLTVDVLLLADIFENFRDVCMSNYGLDPCHYCTLPSYAWDACLKMVDVELELITDPDMYAFVENGIRGGISVISHRYAQANNPYTEKQYDPDKATSYILYLDANNLYGWAMVQRLPVSGFRWLTHREIEGIDWENQRPEDDERGFILEVDLEYPNSLHTMHNDYPLAPERLEICESMLSPYCAMNRPIGLKGTKKLVPNLRNKEKYTLHYKNLQLYLTLGMRLTKVHRVLSFHETNWMEPYITFNTEQRKVASSSFVKDLLKLMNNAVFGKTMENVRGYINVELVTRKERYKKLVANPRYERGHRFTDDLVAVCMKQKSTTLFKPIYVGFCVLELSKVLMYQFHYFHMLPKYGCNRLRLLFTDTDSLCYHVRTEDIYKDMLEDLAQFDTSDYKPDHVLHSLSNKKVPGKFKDEMAGNAVEEFVGLRAKMYSLVCNGIERKRAKGVKRNVVQREITHHDYLETLFEGGSQRHMMQTMRSLSHQIYSIRLSKISLSAYDDKRYILNDGYSSFAYGNCQINQ